MEAKKQSGFLLRKSKLVVEHETVKAQKSEIEDWRF